jgi:hypothetical protein
MLNLIKDTIGGSIIIERKNKYVTWSASNKKDLLKIFAILDKYPLITTSKQCQLEFAKSCFFAPIKDNFFELREKKYLEQDKFIPKVIYLPSYFKGWLSGFIEAKGKFLVLYHPNGKIKNISFSIGLNKDKFLLEMVKLYFESSHSIIMDKNNTSQSQYYRVYLYGYKSRLIIKNHFIKYPLLGNNNISFEKFINVYPPKV